MVLRSIKISHKLASYDCQMLPTERDVHSAILIVAMTLLALAVGAATTHAENRVGLERISAARGSDRFTVLVWYPTRAAESQQRVGLYSLRVAWRAAPAPGRHGLIVISHGSGGDELNHRDTAKALARAGYVVAALRHPGDHWRDTSRVGTRQHLSLRPREVSATLDAVLAKRRFGGRIDARRIGALGLSAGGYAVLAAAGARATPALLPRHCARQPRDARFCAYGWRPKRWGPVDRSARPPRLDGLKDRRIRAVVAMAPIGAVFGPGAFGGVSARVRLYRAGRDGILRYPWHVHHVHRLLRRRHDYVTIPGIGHMTFVAPFTGLVARFAGEAAKDPPGVDRAAVHRRLNREIVVFFNRALN